MILLFSGSQSFWAVTLNNVTETLLFCCDSIKKFLQIIIIIIVTVLKMYI